MENLGDPLVSISDYFAHKNIFITGGTGFLGTVTIETLLRTSPNIGNIYILVRDKNGFTAHSRLQKLLQKPIFEGHSEKTLSKIKLIMGELTDKNFGLDDNTLQELVSKVNIFYHGAATIKFNSHIRTAIRTNVLGTLRTIEFAKQLKNFSSFIYMSTAFANSNYNNTGIILEKFYKPDFDPFEMMKFVEQLDKPMPETGSDELLAILKDHPNTYTFSKQLAENLIAKELEGYAVGVIRPSVVYGTYKDPFPGWCGSANSGHLGLLAGFSKGLLRTFFGNPNRSIDVIPCDYVANATIALDYYVATHKVTKPEVIHCTSGEVNPLHIEDYCRILNESAKKHPNDSFIWKPSIKVRNQWRYKVFEFLFHFLPALFLYIPEKIIPVRKPAHHALDYVKIFDNGCKCFAFFVNQDFRYSLKNSLLILNSLSAQDRETYNYDPRQCDWNHFMESCFLGIRHYHFKESKHTTAYHRLMWIAFNILHWGAFTVAFLVLYKLLSLLMCTSISIVFAAIIIGFLIWI